MSCAFLYLFYNTFLFLLQFFFIAILWVPSQNRRLREQSLLQQPITA